MSAAQGATDGGGSGEAQLHATPSPTEQANPVSSGIDVKGSREIVGIIHEEDLKVWEAVGSGLDVLADVVEQVVGAFQAGGRLVYVGAGTSGRLGVLDAAECPPTFGVAPDLVLAILAGGDAALRRSVEGAEDSASDGATAVEELGVRAQDVVCGIAASGMTPFVWGALEEASVRDATTVLVTCNPHWVDRPGSEVVDFAVVAPVGPEIIAGSTRMKAGTATKLVLNTISTASMIRLGKVYDNLMVDVVPVNKKLQRRAVGLVAMLAGVDPVKAQALLDASGGDVKTAVVVGRNGVDPGRARELLDLHGGVLRKALEGAERQMPPDPKTGGASL